MYIFPERFLWCFAGNENYCTQPWPPFSVLRLFVRCHFSQERFVVGVCVLAPTCETSNRKYYKSLSNFLCLFSGDIWSAYHYFLINTFVFIKPIYACQHSLGHVSHDVKPLILFYSEICSVHNTSCIQT